MFFRQRRDVIPKCSTHHNQELLFCETCDTVFCSICTGGTHKPPQIETTTTADRSPSHTTAITPATTDHTVIPFSVAIKRMSEILIYKANECTAKVIWVQADWNHFLHTYPFLNETETKNETGLACFMAFYNKNLHGMTEDVFLFCSWTKPVK